MSRIIRQLLAFYLATACLTAGLAAELPSVGRSRVVLDHMKPLAVGTLDPRSLSPYLVSGVHQLSHGAGGETTTLTVPPVRPTARRAREWTGPSGLSPTAVGHWSEQVADPESILVATLEGIYVLSGIGGEITRTPIHGPARVRWLGAADLDGSGTSDVIVLDDRGCISSSLRINKKFEPGIGTSCSLPVESVVASEFDGDGVVDLVGAASGRSTLTFFRGDGNGGFEVTEIPSPVPFLTALDVGDFNGDGYADLAALSHRSHEAAILFGDGHGRFVTNVALSFVHPVAVRAGDFDGDQSDDVAVLAEGRVNILRQIGKGGAPESVAVSTGAENFAVGDFGEGQIVVATSSHTEAWRYTDSPSVTYLTATSAGSWLELMDIDGDRSLDVVSVESSGLVHVIFGAEVGRNIGDSGRVATVAGQAQTISTTVILSSSQNPSRAATPVAISARVSPAPSGGFVAFYDGSSLLTTVPIKPDGAASTTVRLVAARHLLRASYLGNSQYEKALSAPVEQTVLPESQVGLGPAVGLGTDESVSAFIAADFNGDGIHDLAATSCFGGLSIFIGSSTGVMKSGGYYSLPAGCFQSLAAADINSDGNQDIVVADYAYGKLLTFEGIGDGTFRAARTIGIATTTPSRVQLEDIDQDGFADLIVANQFTSKVSVLKGDGTGGFAPLVESTTDPLPSDLAVVDVNRDGQPDIITFHRTSISILKRVTGSFMQSSIALPLGFAMSSACVGDVTGDGVADVFVLDFGRGSTLLVKGEADGSFAQPMALALPQLRSGGAACAIGRPMSGSKPSVVVTQPMDNTIHVISIEGTASHETTLAVGPSTYERPDHDYLGHVLVQDVNGDGLDDALLARSSGVVVSFGQSSGSPIAIGFSPPASLALNESPTALSAVSTSGLPVSFMAGPASVCELNTAGQLAIKAAGHCGVVAFSAGSTSFGGAAVPRQIRVGKPQAITFPAIEWIGGVALRATASSGLRVTYTTDTPTVCSMVADTVAVRQAGTCTVVARQDGDATWAPAPSITRSVSVQGKSQTVVFAAPDQLSLTSVNSLEAAASSGLPVTFLSFSPDVCSLSGRTLNLLLPGTCVISAQQPGNGVFAAAEVTRSIRVGRSQVLSLVIPAVVALASTTALSATAPGGAVAFASTTPSVCMVNGSVLLALQAGQCSLTGTQGGGGEYLAASATWTINVKRPQTITVAPIAVVTLGDAPVSIAATATSGLAVTLTSSTPATCTILGGKAAQFLAAGTCTLVASQPGDSVYVAAPPTTFSFNILRGRPTITFANLNQTYAGLPRVPTVTTIPAGLPVSLSYPGTSQPTNAGTYTVLATVATENYVGTALATLVIAKATPVISWRPGDISYGMALSATQLNASSSVAGSFSYTPPAGTILPLGTQSLTVTFTPQQSNNYSSVAVSTSIVVAVSP